jgi:hypothetical protein
MPEEQVVISNFLVSVPRQAVAFEPASFAFSNDPTRIRDSLVGIDCSHPEAVSDALCRASPNPRVLHRAELMRMGPRAPGSRDQTWSRVGSRIAGRARARCSNRRESYPQRVGLLPLDPLLPVAPGTPRCASAGWGRLRAAPPLGKCRGRGRTGSTNRKLLTGIQMSE